MSNYPGYDSSVEHPQGTTVLALGVIGIFVPIVCFFAWYFGNKARADVQTSPAGHYSNESAINAGRVLGLVFSILTIASVVVTVVGVIILAVGFAAIPSTS